MSMTDTFDPTQFMVKQEGSATAQGAPFFKLWDFGDAFVGALASDPSVAEVRRRIAKTTQEGGKTVTLRDAAGQIVYDTKPDGSFRMEEVIHLVAIEGSTAWEGTKGSPDAKHVTPGGHYRTSVSKFLWGKVIEARKNLPAVTAGDKVLVGPGESTCQDIYLIAVTHKSAAIESDTEQAQLAAAGLKVEVDGQYRRVVIPNKEAQLKWLEIRMGLGLEVRAPRKEIGVKIRRVNPANPAEVEAVKAAFQLWQDKCWLNGRQDAEAADEEHAPADAAAVAASPQPQPQPQPAPEAAPSAAFGFGFDDDF